MPRGTRMDKPEQHARRADILNFPNMSRKDEQLLQTVLNDNSSLRLRRAKPEPRDISIAWRNCPPGESPAGFFFASGPRLQKIKPASTKNPDGLQGRGRATGYLQGSPRGYRCLNERPCHKDRRHLPRYRHHRVGICIFVLEMACNQGTGKFAIRDPSRPRSRAAVTRAPEGSEVT